MLLTDMLRFGLGCGFYVFFFFGNPNKSGISWASNSNSVGFSFNWANSNETPCPKCQDRAAAGLVISDDVALTPSLIDYLDSPRLLKPISVKSLAPKDVVPFFTKHLQWEIIDVSPPLFPP